MLRYSNKYAIPHMDKRHFTHIFKCDMILVHNDVFALSSNDYYQQGRLKCVSIPSFKESITVIWQFQRKKDGVCEWVSASEDRHTNCATIKVRLTSFNTPYYSHIPFTWNT